jgi:oligopeptide/dipeptide ABC transporter ATP-binding protein
MEVFNTNQKRANLSRLARPANDSLLCVRNLSVRFRLDSHHEANVLKRINFTIAPGEIVGLLGESGSGKTTTVLGIMQMLPSAARIVEGEIDFQDCNLLALDARRLRSIRGSEISLIYQDSNVLNPVMRVGDQVMEVLRAHKSSSVRQMRDEVYSILAATGFTDCDRIFRAYPHQLSGGQRRRIAIAQALVCKPRLIIADEPTAWLDSRTTEEILSLFARLRNDYGTAFLLISHEPQTLMLADRALVMYAGEIVESGPLEELFSDPKHPYLQALLQCRSFANRSSVPSSQRQRFFCIPGQAPDPSDTILGCCFSSRCNDRMRTCDSHRPDLIAISSFRSVSCFKYADEARV